MHGTKTVYAIRNKTTNIIERTRNTSPYKKSEIPIGHEAIKGEKLHVGGTFKDDVFSKAAEETRTIPDELKAVLDIAAPAEPNENLKKVIELIQSQYI